MRRSLFASVVFAGLLSGCGEVSAPVNAAEVPQESLTVEVAEPVDEAGADSLTAEIIVPIDEAGQTDEETSTAEAAEIVDEYDIASDSLDRRLSYMIGSNLGKQIKRDEIELDMEALNLGIRDVMAGQESRLTDAQIQTTMKDLYELTVERQARESAELAERGAANKNAGEAFLAENGQKPGVVTTTSGLQYKVLKAGTGAMPDASDKVKVHYEGTLLDGTVFDSSYERGRPEVFAVTGVIAGWIEALKLMPVGSTWELYVPSDLAYGEPGTGGAIGPNETLKFTVELIEIME